MFYPKVSSTASNVGYGFWSHDIVGPGSDHELYLRWLQWGCVSGIMRNHDRVSLLNFHMFSDSNK